MAAKRNSVTIVDVAKAAGVSVTTVSRVLNDKDDVADDTYHHVRDVINELGYSSSLAARSMRSRKTNVIGVIMPDVSDPFSVQVIKGVNKGIVELNYDLLIYTSGDYRRNISAATEQKYVSLLNGSVTDGLIVVTPLSSSFSSTSPVISIDPNVNDPTGPAVISTNFKGAIDATEHLIKLGHKRIGYIGGREDLLSAQQRFEGYQAALKNAGIPFEDELFASGNFTTETAIKCARQLLTLPEPPTAIFAANDQSAFGVLIVAESLNISIPEQLSVIGFDNVPEATYRNLTTIDQYIDRLGYVGTKLLVDLIERKSVDSNVQKNETKLIVRGTTSAIGKT